MVSLQVINGKPGIHPPKEGDEGGALLTVRGGEVRVRDSKRNDNLSNVSEPNKSHNYVLRKGKEYGQRWA